MRGNTLEEGKGVADAVGGMSGECWRGEKGVDGDDFLKKGGNGSVRMPQDGS